MYSILQPRLNIYLLPIILFMSASGTVCTQTADDFLALGDESLVCGKLQVAIANYTKALSLDKTLYQADYGRRFARYALGDTAITVKDFTEAIARHPGFARAYNFRGIVKSSSGDRNGAIEDFTACILKDSDFVDAYCNRGRENNASGDTLGAANDYRNAIAAYTRIVRKNPKVAVSMMGLGEARFYLDDYNGAITDFTKIIEQNPENSEAYYCRGNCKAAVKDTLGAIADYTRTIELSPENATAYHQRAYYRFWSGNLNQAESDCETALRYDSTNADDYFIIGLVKLSRHDSLNRQSSIRYLSQAIRLTADTRTNAIQYYYRATVFAECGELKNAADDYTTATRLDPQYTDAFIGLGDMLLQTGDTVGAIAGYTKAIQLDSSNSNVFDKRGQIRCDLREYNEALKDCNRAITQMNAFRSSYYQHRALVYFNMGGERNLLKALVDCDTIIKRNNKDWIGYGTRSMVCESLGWGGAAIADMTKAIECATSLHNDSALAQLYVIRADQRHRQSDITGACQDMHKALLLGYTKAQESLDNWECK